MRYRGYWDLFLAFNVGIGAMAVEMIASRVLAPFFGASLFVWTSLILTILIALAVGYWFGGAMAERGVDDRFVGLLLAAVGLLLAAGVWVSGGFSVALTSLLAQWSNASMALFLGSLAAAATIFALPVMVMGALGPILLKRLAATGDVGKASGRYLFVSTLGSATGTLLPTLILIPAIGSRHSLELVALLFVILGVATLPRSHKLLPLVTVLPILGLSMARTVPSPATVFQTESPYQLIRVTENDGRRYMIFNEGTGIQSVYDLRPAQRTGMYFDFFSLLPLLRPFHNGDHRVAVLGLAGGTAVGRYAAWLPPGDRSIDFVGVEIDAAVIGVARGLFGLDDLPVRVVNQDARTFLQASPPDLDTVIVDAYSTQLYIPPHLASAEFFGLVRSRLKPGGLLAMNINTTSTGSDLFRSLTAAVASRFDSVVALPVPGSYNFIVIASDRPLDLAALEPLIPTGYDDVTASLRSAVAVRPGPADRIFTDDWAPVEFMTDSMIVAEAFRQKRQGG